jgi:hypothetical protein
LKHRIAEADKSSKATSGFSHGTGVKGSSKQCNGRHRQCREELYGRYFGRLRANLRFIRKGRNNVGKPPEQVHQLKQDNMQTIGRLFGILALIGMLIGLIPLFGWLNWLNIPLAIIGLLLCIIGKSKGGIIICIVAIFFGLFRLMLGGGIL